MGTRDLWGELGVPQSIETPRAILREQANLLKEKTGGEVLAEIHRGEPWLDGSKSLTYSLGFVVPALNDYHFGLLQIKHPAELYPAEVVDSANGGDYVCVDKDELLMALKAILSSPRVHRVLALLIAQSMEA